MVSADMGGFKKAVAKGDRSTGEVEGQTLQYARLVNLLGVEMVIVGINKMEKPETPPERCLLFPVSPQRG